MADQLLIHVGYHKSGTTWLQNCLFSNEAVGFISPWGNQAGIAADLFINSNPFKFSADSASELFRDGLDSAIAKGLVPVLSNEAMCGEEHPRKRYERSVADRLKETFPNAKILISIRNQKSTILSHYRQHIAKGYGTTLNKYLGAGELAVGFAPECVIDHFDYDAFVAYYQSLFGKENVLVILQEQMIKELQIVCDEVADFVGMDRFEAPKAERQRVGMTGLAISIRRRLNKMGIGIPDWSKRKQSIGYTLSAKFCNAIDKFTPSAIDARIESSYKQRVANTVTGKFAESNQRLAVLIDKDLTKYGYEL
jgi:hypothetical protein